MLIRLRFLRNVPTFMKGILFLGQTCRKESRCETKKESMNTSPPRIVTKHLDTLPSHKYFKFHRLGASTRHSKAKAAYLRAAQRECGPEIHRHAAWFQLFFSPGGIMTTYHSCFFHSCYMNHWNSCQVAFDGTSIGKAPLEGYAWHCHSAYY